MEAALAALAECAAAVAVGAQLRTSGLLRMSDSEVCCMSMPPCACCMRMCRYLQTLCTCAFTWRVVSMLLEVCNVMQDECHVRAGIEVCMRAVMHWRAHPTCKCALLQLDGMGMFFASISEDTRTARTHALSVATHACVFSFPM